MARFTPPIPQDPIKESFVWRDWFQRLSDKVFGTLAQQDANNVSITGGAISNIDLVGNNISNAHITDSYLDSTPIGLSIPSTGHFTSVILDTPLSGVPITKTADFTVNDGETWFINNKSAATCTVTLPTASAQFGRTLNFQSYQAQALVSAASNVVPIVGGAASTALLNAVAGDSCTIVSDGTNWLMTQYVPNNILLLE